MSVKIFNARGNEITELFNGPADAGRHEFVWTGVDAGSSKVGSGIYFVHMKAGGYTETKKIAIIK